MHDDYIKLVNDKTICKYYFIVFSMYGDLAKDWKKDYNYYSKIAMSMEYFYRWPETAMPANIWSNEWHLIDPVKAMKPSIRVSFIVIVINEYYYRTNGKFENNNQ